MSSLQIGKAIYTILAKKYISKVFPLVADEGTTFPLQFISVVDQSQLNTKDVYNFSELATQILLQQLILMKRDITIAEKVKDILEHSRGTYAGITIEEITLDDADEDYLEDTFIQKLTFKINIK